MAFKKGHGPECFAPRAAGGKRKGKRPPAAPKAAPDPWRSAMERAGKTGS